MIKQDDLNSKSLLKAVNQLMHDSDAREKMAENSKKLGVVDSADEILNLAERLYIKSYRGGGNSWERKSKVNRIRATCFGTFKFETSRKCGPWLPY